VAITKRAILEAPRFWRERRTEFEELSYRQRDVLGIDQEHRKWLKGYCSRLEDDVLAYCDVDGGLDSEFRSRFEDVASQAGIALDGPPGRSPVDHWVSCLCLDLLQNSPESSSRELLQSVAGGGFIVDLLASSAAYCSRLAAKAERQARGQTEPVGRDVAVAASGQSVLDGTTRREPWPVGGKTTQGAGEEAMADLRKIELPLEVHRRDQERRLKAKQDLEKALESFFATLTGAGDIEASKLAEIVGAYAREIYRSGAEGYLAIPSLDPEALFGMAGPLNGGPTLAEVEKCLSTLRVRRPWNPLSRDPAVSCLDDGCELTALHYDEWLRREIWTAVTACVQDARKTYLPTSARSRAVTASPAANDHCLGVPPDSGPQVVEEPGSSDKAGTAEGIEVPHAAMSYPKRAAWLEAELALRQWNVHVLQAQGGPDWKTSRKILNGLLVSRSVLEKTAAALSRKKKQVLFRDIPQE